MDIELDDNKNERNRTKRYLNNRERIISGYLDQLLEMFGELGYLPRKTLVVQKIFEIKNLCISSFRFDDIKLETIIKAQETKLTDVLTGKAIKIYSDRGCTTVYDLLDFHFNRSVSSPYDFCPSGVSQKCVKEINKAIANLGINYKIVWTT